jgi:methylenetetrahydrofolate--tRNA-(uracil-5-)-methyltransferase
MNINYGLLPPIEAPPPRGTDGRKLGKLERTRARKRAIAERALADLAGWAAPALTPA